jgi:hypothetical protein
LAGIAKASSEKPTGNKFCRGWRHHVGVAGDRAICEDSGLVFLDHRARGREGKIKWLSLGFGDLAGLIIRVDGGTANSDRSEQGDAKNSVHYHAPGLLMHSLVHFYFLLSGYED